MNTSRIDSSVSSQPDGLSRRSVVGVGATGLALALLARSFSQAAAQDASPAAGGMPAGVAAFPLTNVPIPAADVPAGGFTLSLYRVTIEPGASAPDTTYAYPELAYVESGTLICPGEAPRFVIHADGSVEEVGDGDITVNTGESIYVPPGVLDGARNDGTEQLSALVIDLLPMGEMATPSP